MALGINFEGTSGGDILPIIKFDAKAGDFIRQDRVQDAAGQGVKNEEELPQPLKFAMDMATLEVGWLSFQSGAPDFRMVKVGEAVPTKPEGDFKSAFRVRIASKELGLREFSHSAKTVMKAMDQLHNQFESEKGHNPDKVPVVEVSGTVPVKVNTPQGELRFKAPDWKIVSWVDKPEMFDKKDTPKPEAIAEDDLF